MFRNLEDHLAWRTLIQTRKNSLGQKSLSEIYNFALEKHLTFYQAVINMINGGISTNFTQKLKSEYNNILSMIDAVRNQIELSQEEELSVEQTINNVVSEILKVEGEKSQIQQRLLQICQALDITSFDDVVDAIKISSLEDVEIQQETDKEKININNA